VILLSDESIGHMLEKVDFPDQARMEILNRPRPEEGPSDKYLPYATDSPEDIPRIPNFGEGYHFNVTGLVHDLDGFPINVPEKTEALLGRLHEKIDSRIREICMAELTRMDDASVVLCSCGSISRSCDQVVRDARANGLKVGGISLKTIWPFPDFIFDELGPQVKTVAVCEMNMGQIVKEVQRASKGRFEVIGVNSVRGTVITPREITKAISTCL